MKIPRREETESFLAEAGRMNPGPWVQHSREVAKAAQAIARRHPRLDADAAYILGCLHDIGRRFGVTDMRHALDGYTFLHGQGFDDAARICLTHSHAVKDINAVASRWDCTPAEYAFVRDYLAAVEYNDYDRLIQLCDALALPSGPCLMEKRLVDIALRYGLNDFTLPRWQACFELQRHFEQIIGGSIYALLPEVVENTFGALG